MMEALVPRIAPTQRLKAPEGAIHYEVILGAAAINFDNNTIGHAQTSTGWQPLATGSIEPQHLKAALPARLQDWVFAGIGIHFGIAQGGVVLPMSDKAHQAFGMQRVELIT